MPDVIVTNREGEVRSVSIPSGRTLMQGICEAGIDELLALCGGVCSCATCHVYVDSGQSVQALPPLNDDESDLLAGSTYRTEHSRLSCQIRVDDDLAGLRVTIAPED